MRESSPPRILMNLCVSIIALDVLFVAGVDTRDHVACTCVAILLQYFMLTTVTWSAVEAYHSTHDIFYPMRVEVDRFMMKASFFAWGMFPGGIC